jgi:DNA-binding NarL/FixJ family response regulator
MSRRVLLIDDNPKFTSMLREFLSDLDGIEVVGEAFSGEEALSLIDAITPDILIVDLSMPGMSGLDLTQTVKARWPEIAAVVLTLLDTPRHRQAALDAGADAFVGKASMDSDLIPAIQQFIAA